MKPTDPAVRRFQEAKELLARHDLEVSLAEREFMAVVRGFVLASAFWVTILLALK